MSSSLRDLLSLDGFRSSTPSLSSSSSAVSLLSGHLRQFSSSPSFRRRLHRRCSAAISTPAAVSSLYLAVAAALQDRHSAAALHLLHLFSSAPRLARLSLLPELWDLFFLPHLLPLHLSFKQRLSSLSSDLERETLCKSYEDQLDLATVQLASNYRNRLAAASTDQDRKSTYKNRNRPAATNSDRGVSRQNEVKSDPAYKNRNRHGEAVTARSRSPFSFLSCRSLPNVERKQKSEAESVPETWISRFDEAVSVISKSRSLRECETAVEEISRAWIGCGGDPAVSAAVLAPPVAEGLLEVLFASREEKILESAISLLADLVSKSESSRNAILKMDPEIETFLKLFKNRRLFLKAAVLLYLIKPRAENFASTEWIPLILKVLEEGDQRQRLLSVQCRPRSAAFYFLEEILCGFDAGRNAENAKEVFAAGGLEILLQKFEEGTDREIYSATNILLACIRSEKVCGEFVAEKMNKASLIEILAGDRLKSRECALALLVEVVSLCRTKKMRSFLEDFGKEGRLNVMHVLLVYLQRAPAEQRPLAAAILLQIDLLLGDPSLQSVYREEAVDALAEALHSNSRKKVQQSCTTALCILSPTPEPSMESHLLKKSGVNFPTDKIPSLDQEEEAAMENWGRRLSSIMIRRESEKFSSSLASCLSHGIPSLARSCLVMLSWLSCFTSPSTRKMHLWAAAWSPLIPSLLGYLSSEREMEERVLAAFSIRNLARNSEILARKIMPLDKKSAAMLRDLAEVTWAAKDILMDHEGDQVSSRRPSNPRR